jgi:Ser/Thr protein kinase RdoA (MazF antagonist)
MAEVDDEVAHVLSLLPAGATATPLDRFAGAPNAAAIGIAIKRRPWAVDYGTTRAVLRRSDPGRFRALGLDATAALESVEWLHSFLRDLAMLGFTAPAPRPDLNGRSIAVEDGAIWELLTYVPGGPIGRSDAEVLAAGQLLARFHLATLQLPLRPQRPGAMPVAESRPAHPEARPVLARFDLELESIGHARAPHAVIHGDATDANVIADGNGYYHLVDYAIAQLDAVLSDVGSALWRIGRPDVERSAYDADRVELFIRGYSSVRSLTTSDARAVVVYMKGRGLQLQRRLELRGGRDDSIMERLLTIATLSEKLTAAAVRASA